MAPTLKQILFRTAIAFLVVLIVLKFMPPIAVTTSQTLLGTIATGTGLFTLVISALMRRGKVKAGALWGRTAAEAFWQGIGILALGLGHLSHLVVTNDTAVKLRMASALVFIGAILVARKRAKAVTAS